MKEEELQENTIDTCRLFKVRAAHFRPAMTKHGWRTPVAADGKGFPDLVMVGPRQLAVAELKGDSAPKKVPEDQVAWLEAFRTIGIPAFVWRPPDWTSGHIERVIRLLGQGLPVAPNN
ncbi:MAG: VRR-NUC domain-containing protein [Patescibacteria group bacterium]|nr:VRR-NUC domain-containing protein [Patescibacteria group bacterium]